MRMLSELASLQTSRMMKLPLTKGSKRVKHRLIRGLSAALVMAATAMAGWACADTMSDIRDRGEFRIGHRESSFPLSFIGPDRVAAGYSVDICMRIFEAIKVELKRPDLKVRLVPVSPSDRIRALVDKQVDVECGSTTNTLERRRAIEFSYTTFMAGTRLLVKASSGLRDIADLRGKRVGVTAKTTTEEVIRSFDAGLALGLKVVTAKDHGATFALLEKGDVDAIVNDDVNLLGLIARTDNPANYVFIGKSLSAEPLAIMYRRQDPYFERVVDGAVASLFYSREIYAMYAKWFEAGNPRLPMSLQMRENVKFPNKHGAL